MPLPRAISPTTEGSRAGRRSPARRSRTAVFTRMAFKDATRVDALLSDLCTSKGICLAPDDYDELVSNPPADVETFVDAILVADGHDPVMVDKQVRRWVTESVRAWIFDDGHGKGTASGLPLRRP